MWYGDGIIVMDNCCGDVLLSTKDANDSKIQRGGLMLDIYSYRGLCISRKSSIFARIKFLTYAISS